MKRSYPRRFLRTPASWFARRPISMLWCHISGATISILILAATAYVWSQRNTSVTWVTAGDVAIDIDAATQLISQADHWRRQYTTLVREAEAIDARVVSIRGWLPIQPDLDSRREIVRAAAEANGITLTAFELQGTHLGQRVGVAAATCHLDGSFPDLCRFLHTLSSAENGIECDRIVLQRVPAELGDQASGLSPCAAIVSLRIPFAADSTFAARLLDPGTHDAG